MYILVHEVMMSGLAMGGHAIPRLTYILLLLIAVNPAFTGYSRSSAEEAMEAYSTLPRFEPQQPTEILAVAGQPIQLPCTVYSLADKLVSWVRTRDLNILTHGTTTFTADSRFDIQHQQDSDAWILKIRTARLNDTGRYECQVNTDPKMSLFFNLDVQEHASPVLKAYVSGPKQQYVKVGSTVTFVCEVTLEGHTVEGATLRNSRPIRKGISVHWLHNGLAVSFQAERGGISIDTVRSDQGISSRLTVAGVGDDDAGRYTCGAGDAADSVMLHVLEEGEDYGEHMEAMQRDQASSGAEKCSLCEPVGALYAALVLVTSHYVTVR